VEIYSAFFPKVFLSPLSSHGPLASCTMTMKSEFADAFCQFLTFLSLYNICILLHTHKLPHLIYNKSNERLDYPNYLHHLPSSCSLNNRFTIKPERLSVSDANYCLLLTKLMSDIDVNIPEFNSCQDMMYTVKRSSK